MILLNRIEEVNEYDLENLEYKYLFTEIKYKEKDCNAKLFRLLNNENFKIIGKEFVSYNEVQIIAFEKEENIN